MTPRSRSGALPPDPRTAANRFAGGGIARVNADFTDREHERAEIARSLRTPNGHVVVSGLRRMGKTSILIAVRDDLVAQAHPVLYVDLWTASTVEDMTTRLAEEAAVRLGRRWTDTISKLGSRLKFGFEIAETDAGVMVPVPKVEFREAPLVAQRKRLVDALDLLEELATKERTHLGVILDEFQEIERLGSEGERPLPRRGGPSPSRTSRYVSAMRQVRAAIQHHAHVTYVFAGSDRRLIRELHDEDGGALHNLGRKYEIGPIETAHFARWIEEQFGLMGIDAAGFGERIIDVAGPRTRDVRTLAETVAELARDAAVVTEPLIVAGMEAVVRQRRAGYEEDWKPLTAVQQNVLRAVAAEGAGLARAEVRRRFGLREASTVTKTVDALTDRHVLLRDGAAVVFDDPFYRAWVIRSTLRDVGLHLRITHVPPGNRSSSAEAPNGS